MASRGPAGTFQVSVGSTFSNIANAVSYTHSVIPGSYSNIFLGNLEVASSQLRANIAAPLVSFNIWKNNEEYEVYNGVKKANSTERVTADTEYPLFSQTKSITALLYARLKTLGIISNVKRMDDIYPQMKNINWVTTTLSTDLSNANADYTGRQTQTQYKLATDVFAVSSAASGVPQTGYSNFTSTLAVSNAYVYFYDFDTTVQRMYTTLKVANMNTTALYTTFGGETYTYGDYIDAFYFGFSGAIGGGLSGDMGALVALATITGFTPTLQAFQQSNTHGSVLGTRIYDKLAQSGSTGTGSPSLIAKGYGVNIVGSSAVSTSNSISTGFLAASNAFIPVFTTQYMVQVATQSVGGVTVPQYGGALDPLYSVHPEGIPTGVSYKQNYQVSSPFGVTNPPVVNAAIGNLIFYSPLSQSIYINTTSAAARPLYLDDIFAESVGFVGGYEHTVFGNGDYGGIWGITNNDLNSNIAQSLSTYNLQKFGFNIVAELARSAVGIASNTNPVNHVVDMASNVNYCTSNTVSLPDAYTSGYNANTYITRFLNNFQGQTYVQLLPHGVFNYNSSSALSTACLTELYNRYYGTTLSYYQILKKELLDPAGSTAYYYDPSRLSNLATPWAVDPSFADFSKAFQYYVPSDNSSNPLLGLNSSNVNSYFGSALAFQATLPEANRVYIGAWGLHGSLKDVSKIFRVVARKGLDQNGNRLISEREIVNLTIPRISELSYSGAQNYFPTMLNLVFDSPVATFGLGGATYGLGYGNKKTSDPTGQNVNGPIGRAIRDANPLNLFNDVNGSVALSWCAAPVWSWAGAGGTFHAVGLDEQFVMVGATMESVNQFGLMIRDGIYNHLGNEIYAPSSNNYVYSTSGVVPLIPEIVGGRK